MKFFLAAILSVTLLVTLNPQTYADAQTDAAAELAIASALAAHHRKAPASDDVKLFSQAVVDQMIDNAVFKDRLDRELEAQKSGPTAQYVDVRVCDGNSCHIERRLKSSVRSGVSCPNGLCPDGTCGVSQCTAGCNCPMQSFSGPVMSYGSSGGGCANGQCGSSGGGRGFIRRGGH